MNIQFSDTNRRTLWHDHSMLIDAGTSFSLVSTEGQAFSDWAPKRVKWEGFSGTVSKIRFSEPKLFQIGSKIGVSNFGLCKLEGTRIIDCDLLGNLGVVVDLPNRSLRITGQPVETYVISARHLWAAVKAAEKSFLLQWESDVLNCALSVVSV